jgi:hypothetical protein
MAAQDHARLIRTVNSYTTGSGYRLERLRDAL